MVLRYQLHDQTIGLRMQQSPARDWTARRSRRVVPDTATDDTTIGCYQYSASIASNRRNYYTRPYWRASEKGSEGLDKRKC